MKWDISWIDYLFLKGVINILDQFQLFKNDKTYATEWNEITISLPDLEYLYPFVANDRLLHPVASKHIHFTTNYNK